MAILKLKQISTSDKWTTKVLLKIMTNCDKNSCYNSTLDKTLIVTLNIQTLKERRKLLCANYAQKC